MTAVLLLLALQPLVGARTELMAQEEDISLSIVGVDDTAFPEVTVVLTADRRGRPVADVQLDELQIEESGSPATPVSIQRAVDKNIPLALVLALDVSGSMAGPTLDSAKASAIDLIDRLAPTDSSAVLSFADGVRVEQPLSPDKALLVDAVSRLSAAGNTALYDAVAQSAVVAVASGVPRRAVVLLSDGEEFGSQSQLTREQSLAAASEAASLFYVIGVGPNVDRIYLEELASRSGGKFFYVTGASEVAAVYASLEELLRSQYVVTFNASSDPAYQDRSVKVSVLKDGSTGTATREYRSLRPPAPPPATAPPTPVPTAEPEAVAEETTGGSLPVAAVAAPIGLAVALVGLGASRWLLRRRAARTPRSDRGVLARTASEAPDAVSRAVLIVASGPSEGQRFELGEQPVTIGSGSRCRIRLPAAPGFAREHARMWWRDGRLMLHHVAPNEVTTLAGESVVWAALEDGDEVEMGPYVLRCQSDQATDHGD